MISARTCPPHYLYKLAVFREVPIPGALANGGRSQADRLRTRAGAMAHRGERRSVSFQPHMPDGDEGAHGRRVGTLPVDAVPHYNHPQWVEGSLANWPAG